MYIKDFQETGKHTICYYPNCLFGFVID